MYGRSVYDLLDDEAYALASLMALPRLTVQAITPPLCFHCLGRLLKWGSTERTSLFAASKEAEKRPVLAIKSPWRGAQGPCFGPSGLELVEESAGGLVDAFLLSDRMFASRDEAIFLRRPMKPGE